MAHPVTASHSIHSAKLPSFHIVKGSNKREISEKYSKRANDKGISRNDKLFRDSLNAEKFSRKQHLIEEVLPQKDVPEP